MTTEVWLLGTVAVVWGAAVGLLLARPAYRLAVGPQQPWRADCPGGHPLPGWLGPARCRGCPGPYGRGRVALPAVTALLCGALAAATGPRPELLVWLLLTPAGVLLAAVDLRVRRLPDVLTLPLAVTALALLGVAALLPEHAGRWTGASLGALALSGGHLVLHLISPAGMGFGDVKLALTTGAVLGWYGWGVLLLGAFAGFLLGGLYGLALVVLRRADRRTEMPFGPFLLAGAFLGLLAGAYAA
ncbi:MULTISPECIES: A24 family peptidase [Streptomyces]|uniref:A24 family peptidase n=1 Tax=Streptomyces chilikensis TaxID=1194079 RepID=A0ABV3EIH4_9ACTN|nr:A24 family peptidase [Streptomyces sp. MJP52]MDH6225635.1 leader peptidase (prepilin peptidase)/N-methyltransferase [Streptomyces sp. MJP52]